MMALAFCGVQTCNLSLISYSFFYLSQCHATSNFGILQKKNTLEVSTKHEEELIKWPVSVTGKLFLK